MVGIMCEYFSIFCHSIMPPPVHCPNLRGVKIMKTRLSHKFFCLLLTVVMACTLLPITALAAEPSGSIERVGITHDNGVLKNAVSVDLKNVNFESSVQVQLYRDETPLTTATLQGVNPGSYGSLTCCIATETADANWALIPWTPKDDVVPNRAVLVVDGHEQDTKTFTLDTDEWANLPGTVRPSSNVTNGPSSNVTNGTASNNDKLVILPNTGDTSNLALWIALLFISGGAAIGTTVVSRKKKYNR